MQNTLSKLVLAASTASLALTPIAVQAGTRAGDNAAVYTASVAQPGMAREADGEGIVGGFSIVPLLVGFYFGAWTTLFISEVTDDDEFQSTGV